MCVGLVVAVLVTCIFSTATNCVLSKLLVYILPSVFPTHVCTCVYVCAWVDEHIGCSIETFDCDVLLLVFRQ